MKAKVQKIGNSFAIILPTGVAERFDLEEEVELTISRGQVIIHMPKKDTRTLWEAQFEKGMESQQKESETIWEFPNKWDEGEWEW